MYNSQEIFENLRKQKIVADKVPLSTGLSLPVPLVVDNELNLVVFAYPFSGSANEIKSIYPPLYVLLITYPDGCVKEIYNGADYFKNHEYSFDKQIGAYPGKNLQRITRDEYNALWNTYFKLTDDIFTNNIENLNRENKDWLEVFHKLAEEGMLSFYEFASPKLFGSKKKPSNELISETDMNHNNISVEDNASVKSKLGQKHKVLSALDKLSDFSKEFGFTSISFDIDNIRNRSNANDFYLVVLGEFSRGKTELINSLLGEKLLPVSIKPTTATINVIKYGTKRKAKLFFRDGQTKEIECSLESFCHETVDNIDQIRKIRYLEIEYPSDLLADGLCLVDTPGVNDPDEHRMAVTYGFIPNADAILFVMDIAQALSKSETRFLTEGILKDYTSNIFFILNKADTYEDEDTTNSELQETIVDVKKRLETYTNSERLYTISAKKTDFQPVLNDKSFEIGFKSFKDALISYASSDTMHIQKYEQLIIQVKSLGQALINDIDSVIAISINDVNALEKEKYDALHSCKRAEESFNYIQSTMKNDFDKFLIMLEKELSNSINNTREKFIRGIKEQTNIRADQYVERNLKKCLLSFTENYFKAHVPYIEKTIGGYREKVQSSFVKEFSKLIITSYPSLIRPITDEIKDENNRIFKQFNDLLKMPLPNIARIVPTILGSVFLTPILGPIGTVLGGIIGAGVLKGVDTLRYGNIDKQVNNIKPDIDKAFYATYNEIKIKLKEALDSYYDLLVSELTTAFDSIIINNNQILDNAISMAKLKNDEFGNRKAELEELKCQIHGILDHISN